MLLSTALLSCTKWLKEDDRLQYITFGVNGLETDTKSLITNEDFNNGTPKVYVYGWRNNTNQIFNKIQITKEANSSNWITNPQRQWSPGSSYTFHAITQSPDSPGNGASISSTNNGLKITVSQPTSYSEANMVDYMLSHSYKVSDGSNYHIVMLYMEHAMSCVEIVVEKEMEEHNIVLENITLSNIYRSATMQCDGQATANSGNTNKWSIQLSGNNEQDYSAGPFAEPTDGVTTLGEMTILAVPQQLTNATTLSVTYTVTEYAESTKRYTQEFQLYNYTPYVWESGHKITYTLTINTGVQLKAHIADWIDGGYIEGVII